MVKEHRNHKHFGSEESDSSVTMSHMGKGSDTGVRKRLRAGVMASGRSQAPQAFWEKPGVRSPPATVHKALP